MNHPRVNIHWIHCFENFFTVQHFWTTCRLLALKNKVFPENFHCIDRILFKFRIFEQLALALKNRVALKFFTVLKYFLSYRNFEQLALVLKTEFALNVFIGLKYFSSFRNFEQLALALKTELPWKFLSREGGSPPTPASNAYGPVV